MHFSKQLAPVSLQQIACLKVVTTDLHEYETSKDKQQLADDFLFKSKPNFQDAMFSWNVELALKKTPKAELSLCTRTRTVPAERRYNILIWWVSYTVIMQTLWSHVFLVRMLTRIYKDILTLKYNWNYDRDWCREKCCPWIGSSIFWESLMYNSSFWKHCTSSKRLSVGQSF